MSYLFSVRLGNKAEKQFKTLDRKMRERLETLFKILELNPVPREFHYDLEKLAGREDSYRVRLSSFRAIYRIYWSEKVVRVEKIERKSDSTYD